MGRRRPAVFLGSTAIQMKITGTASPMRQNAVPSGPTSLRRASVPENPTRSVLPKSMSSAILTPRPPALPLFVGAVFMGRDVRAHELPAPALAGRPGAISSKSLTCRCLYTYLEPARRLRSRPRPRGRRSPTR